MALVETIAFLGPTQAAFTDQNPAPAFKGSNKAGAAAARLFNTISAVGDALASAKKLQSMGNGVLFISPAGVLTLTSAPTLPDGYDGQRITLVNVAASTLTLQDEGTLAASNLRLSANTVAIATGGSIELVYSLVLAYWAQTRVLSALV